MPRVLGGLGNQLFMIANAYAYSLRNNYRLVLTTKHKYDSKTRPFYYDNLLSKLSPLIKNNVEINTVYKEPRYNHDVIPDMNGQDIVLEGYFQSEKNFYDYRHEVKSLFDFSDYNQFVDTWRKESGLIGKTVVAVHIRRGDYLLNPHIHTLTSKEYIESSMKILEYSLGYRPVYLYFSDDLDWVRENFVLKGMDRICYTDSDYEDFVIMKSCNHFIISNSSFSWWAAYLSNSDPHKKVFVPKWFGEGIKEEFEDIYVPGWIRMEIN
jgi:hypothetical protein